MVSLIRKDLMLNFAIKASIISLILFLPFMILILGFDDVTKSYPIMILSYGYILTNMPFKYDMRDKPHMLIQSLPIKKKELVISKYISLFINYFIGLVYVWFVFMLIDLLGFKNINNFDISLIKKTLSIYIFISSISLPVYFRLPPKLGNIVNIFIYIFIINSFGIGGGVNDILNVLSKINIQGYILPIVLAILFFLSMEISIFLYETRDFY